MIVSRFAHEQPIVKLAYSPRRQDAVTSAEDRKVKLWQADTITERQLLEPQPDVAAAAAFSAGQQVAGRRPAGWIAGGLQHDGRERRSPPRRPPKPELASLSPRGVERGSPAQIRVTGKHLGDVIEDCILRRPFQRQS